MAKKSSLAAAKAAKKAKAAQKVERKETKKVLKTKGTSSSTSATKGKSKAKKANDSDTDDDDLEGILERVRWPINEQVHHLDWPLSRSVDAKRMGSRTYGDRRARWRTPLATRKRYSNSMPKWKSSVVYWWRILQWGWQSSESFQLFHFVPP